MTTDKHELRVFAGDTALKPAAEPGTITADRGWSPHVQARLNIATPTDEDLTLPGSTLVIELTQRFGSFALTRDLTDLYAGLTTAALTTAFGGGTTATITALITAGSWVSPVRAATGRRFELIITKRTRSRGEHQLELASREVLFQDWLWYEVDGNLEGVSLTFTADTVPRFIERIIAAHRTAHDGWFDLGNFDAIAPSLLYQAAPIAITPTTHTIEAGAGTFAAAQNMLTQARQRIYSPGDASVRIVDYPFTGPGSITVNDTSNLIDWEVSDERSKHTLVRFTGSALDPLDRPIYSSTTLTDAVAPPEVLIEAPHAPVIGSVGFGGFTPEVQPFLNLVGLDASPIRLVVVSDYSVMPGSPVTYTLPDETETTDTIDAITWQLGRAEMDIWI